MKGIILHAGHGTRLRPLTHTGPKQLLPIANKPMSQYCIESLKESGISEIMIVIGGVGSNKVKEYYKDGSNFGVKLSYVEQDSPKGIAHAINLCKDFVKDEKFAVFLGDNFINTSIANFKNEFENSDADASLLLCNVNNPQQFGIAYLDGQRISKMIEKPKNPKSNLAITGIYFLTAKIFQKIETLKPSWRNELEIVDALQMILDEDGKITYHIISDFWKDTGTPNDIIDANRIILENTSPKSFGRKDDEAEINGKVSIGNNSIIKDHSKIIGPVTIGENCVIEGSSIIGPNVSIGNNTKISNCKITNSIVMNNCKIETTISISESIISSNSEISLQNLDQNNKKFLLGEGTKISL